MISTYNLTNDFLFRSVFGKQRNARILCSLINAVLEAKGSPPISGITVTNPSLEGERYAKLKPCIGIHILDYLMFPSFKDFHNQFLFRTGTPEESILTHDLSLHYIELPKLNPGVQSFSNLEKW